MPPVSMDASKRPTCLLQIGAPVRASTACTVLVTSPKKSASRRPAGPNDNGVRRGVPAAWRHFVQPVSRSSAKSVAADGGHEYRVGRDDGVGTSLGHVGQAEGPRQLEAPNVRRVDRGVSLEARVGRTEPPARDRRVQGDRPVRTQDSLRGVAAGVSRDERDQRPELLAPEAARVFAHLAPRHREPYLAVAHPPHGVERRAHVLALAGVAGRAPGLVGGFARGRRRRLRAGDSGGVRERGTHGQRPQAERKKRHREDRSEDRRILRVPAAPGGSIGRDDGITAQRDRARRTPRGGGACRRILPRTLLHRAAEVPAGLHPFRLRQPRRPEGRRTAGPADGPVRQLQLRLREGARRGRHRRPHPRPPDGGLQGRAGELVPPAGHRHRRRSRLPLGAVPPERECPLARRYPAHGAGRGVHLQGDEGAQRRLLQDGPARPRPRRDRLRQRGALRHPRRPAQEPAAPLRLRIVPHLPGALLGGPRHRQDNRRAAPRQRALSRGGGRFRSLGHLRARGRLLGRGPPHHEGAFQTSTGSSTTTSATSTSCWRPTRRTSSTSARRRCRRTGPPSTTSRPSAPGSSSANSSTSRGRGGCGGHPSGTWTGHASRTRGCARRSGCCTTSPTSTA